MELVACSNHKTLSSVEDTQLKKKKNFWQKIIQDMKNDEEFDKMLFAMEHDLWTKLNSGFDANNLTCMGLQVGEIYDPRFNLLKAPLFPNLQAVWVGKVHTKTKENERK